MTMTSQPIFSIGDHDFLMIKKQKKEASLLGGTQLLMATYLTKIVTN